MNVLRAAAAAARSPRWTGAALSALSLVAHATDAGAQQAPDLALNQYQPPEAGDDFMAVPSADAGGHLLPHAQVILDYARDPFVLRDADGNVLFSPAQDQMFLHVGASLSLWDRFLVSASFPLAVLQSGDDANIGGANFVGASGVAAGDLRLGLRGRIWGERDEAFQIAAGGFLFMPTGSGEYSGEGSFYGEPHIIVSGLLPYFRYSANVGAVVRSSVNPSNFVFRAAAGLSLLDDDLLVGPEVFGAVNYADGTFFDGSANPVEREGDASMELLGTIQYRLPLDFVVGAGAGPGLLDGVGTPAVRVLGRVMWDPQPEPEPEPVPTPTDADGDGIPDAQDACPQVVGEPSEDPAKNGCPPDSDGDGIINAEDACVAEPGVPSDDPAKNGCPIPGDGDNDGIIDEDDACPTVPGVASADPTKHGCPPPDGDGDGIIDADDACPTVAGVASDDPAKNGCPPDTDGDTILDPDDACPKEKGVQSPDPSKNGCPRVRVTNDKVMILQKVEFDFGRATIKAVSDQLLDDVAQTLIEHPELELIEVQGHTDNKGNPTFNKALSQRRANAVVAALVKRKVPASRLRSKGYGLEEPIADNGTEAGRAANRRVEFKILKRTKK